MKQKSKKPLEKTKKGDGAPMETQSVSTAKRVAEESLEEKAPAQQDEGPTAQDEDVSEKVCGSTGSCDGSTCSTAPFSRFLLRLNRFARITLCHQWEQARRQRLEVRRDALRKREEARQKYNIPPKDTIRLVFVEEGGTTQVYVGAVGKPSKTGPRPGAAEEFVHIPPGRAALDGGLQVKAVTWPVIAILKKTSFTSEKEATSALEESLRRGEEQGGGACGGERCPKGE